MMHAADNGVESQGHNYSDSDSNSSEEGGTNSRCILDDVRELEVICISMNVIFYVYLNFCLSL